MIHDPAPVVPPLVASTQAVTPSPEPPPLSETILPPHTAEHTQTVDHVFTAPPQHNVAATLLGVWTSALLLRDVAVDAFDTSGEDEPADPKVREDEKDDSAE